MKNLIRIQAWVVFGGFVLFLAKSIAYLITSSNAVLSDALESIVNLTAGAFALYSLNLAAKPEDRNHPYGHGKIEFLSATIEGSLILIAGILIIGKAVYNFFFPQEISSVDIGIYLTGGAGLVNFIMGYILVMQGRKHNSITMESDGKHLLSDGWSTIGLILGLFILYLTKIVWIDNAVASVFGAVIIITGIQILRKAIAGIMDEADTKLLKQIIAALQENRKVSWIDLHKLRVIKFGSRLHLDCHLTVPWYYTVRQGHGIVEDVEVMVQKYFGKQAEMFIHTDPCNEQSCRICSMEDCDVRRHKKEDELDWDLNNVLGLEQHKISQPDE